MTALCFWPVFDDPGPPTALDTLDAGSEPSALYRWAFSLVAVWYLVMCVPLILLVGRLEKKFGRK